MSKLVIAHMYPDLLNLYGDRGNVLALYHRATLRGIDVEIKQILACHLDYLERFLVKRSYRLSRLLFQHFDEHLKLGGRHLDV